MRTFITCAVLAVSSLTIGATTASAQPISNADLIDGWYHRYLGRHVDSHGLRDHLHALRHGTPIDVVEAAILASPEYYVRNGNTPEGYVAALYRDVLGRRATGFDFGREVNYMLTHGRNAEALRVIGMRPVVVASAPPVIVTRPVVDPVVVVPSYRPAPVYVAPRPGISIGIRIR